MLAKLIATLLQAKAGAISGVFLLGATGALISVSASNGVTTVTITEASPSPTTAVTRPVSSPELNVTAPKAAESPKVSADSTACSAEAKAIAMQVQRVNSAFSGFHTQLEKARKDGNKETLEKADKELKSIRQTAVKAIHATRTCKDDEDKDEDKTEAADKDNDEDKDEDDDKAVTAPVTAPTTTVSSAEAIATAAIAKMQTVFDAAKAAAPASTTNKKPEVKQAEGTKRPEAARTPHPTEAQHRD